jgi:hypothetical protein
MRLASLGDFSGMMLRSRTKVVQGAPAQGLQATVIPIRPKPRRLAQKPSSAGIWANLDGFGDSKYWRKFIGFRLSAPHIGAQREGA